MTMNVIPSSTYGVFGGCGVVCRAVSSAALSMIRSVSGWQNRRSLPRLNARAAELHGRPVAALWIVPTVVAAAASVILGGCGNPGAPASTPPESASVRAPEDDVFPQALRNAKSLELGELVLLLMPGSGEPSVGWDFRADSPIKWQTTAAYKEVPESGYASRTGWVRVNVQGRKATILREREFELGWMVEYSNQSSGPPSSHPQFLPPKFGVKNIEIKPGGWGDLTCFGTGFDGCDFEEPFASLVQAGIHVETICSTRMPDGHTSAFLLTHPGRRPTVMTWTRSGGSGGVSSSITLKLDADQHIPQWAHTRTDPDLYESNLCARDD